MRLCAGGCGGVGGEGQQFHPERHHHLEIHGAGPHPSLDWNTIKMTHIHVTVSNGVHLPRKDTGVWGSCDAYCVVRFGDQRFKTKVENNTLHPMWEEGVNFDLRGMIKRRQIEKLVIELWDWDRCGSRA